MKIQPNKYTTNFTSFGFKIFNFEKQSFVFYYKKIFGLPVPVLRNCKHNHWGGAGCFVSEKSISMFLQKKGLKISTIQFDIEGQQMIWLTGHK